MKKIEIRINHFWNVLLTIVSILAVLAIGVRLVVAADFYQKCSTHIYKAERAATADIAADELSIAIKAMEEYGYTSGPNVGILESENEISFCYSNLINYQEEFEKFDSANESTEVYHVELNALQERLKASEPPYLISLGNIVFRWVYIAICSIWFVVAICCWIAHDSFLDSKTFSVRVPSIQLAKTT